MSAAALTPMERQSVWRTLKSPRLLKTELLAGLVVSLALIPEVIAFTVIAGVDPKVGIFASFTMSVVIAITGGRPAMISAAAGAVALVVAPLVRTYGVEYLFATVVLAGVIQVLLALAGVAKLLRFIPRQVMIGFVNGLAILIFLAQMPQLVDVPWAVYPLVALGVLIIYLFPKLTTAVPAPLVAIIVLTLMVVFAGLKVPSVGDQGELPDSLPVFGIPQVPLNLQTLQIIAPFALAVAFVGLLESLLTAKLVDDITDTPSSKTRESWAQGTANIVTGFFGGICGCAMIGQTMIGVKVSGGRTRISTMFAGIFMLLLAVSFDEVVAKIPMAALVAVMVVVSAATFNWHSIRPGTLKMMPKSETFVMLATVVLTVATNNLAVGVGAGILSAMVLFANRVAHLVSVERELHGSEAVYTVHGELFFASSNDLYTQFDYAQDPERVVIDMSDSHLWDASTVAALDSVSAKYESYGKQVEIRGLNEASAKMHERLRGRLD
ncbi:sodium-independent anion transporter [Glutamicibacter uratoxydans]|uniref:Sodium-independent anion transporter n=1 Tax=Glutamicibacter uratoxydans TaxID=43667 RepID=A0A4Y4DKN4_GLUUR|nr:SulP family inorganic anion transporter [Glutamicibacter uratoxydans]GED05153.1 sodium-independent anion transporter [Glutamicibacter uratoxydans]